MIDISVFWVGGEGGRCVDGHLCSSGLKFLRSSQEGEGIDPFLMTSQKMMKYQAILMQYH
jgi:hypothetical protein